MRSRRSSSRTASRWAGSQELTFTEGDDIRFRVESDVAEEVHFHGYDVAEDVAAGGSVEFDVPATHHRGVRGRARAQRRPDRRDHGQPLLDAHELAESLI